MMGLPGRLDDGGLAEAEASPGPKFWLQVVDPLMGETLGALALVLVDPSPPSRMELQDHALYLMRLGRDQPPSVRRVALDRDSGDLLIGTDARDRVPMRRAMPLQGEALTLGRVLWVLKKAH